MFDLAKLRLNPRNPYPAKENDYPLLRDKINEYPEILELRPIVYDDEDIDEEGRFLILGGNKRFRALTDLGYEEVPEEWVRPASGLSEEAKHEFVIGDNVGFGDWDKDILREDWDIPTLRSWGFDIEEKIDNAQEGETIEVPQSVQLKPPMEYILIMAEPNSEDWEELKMFLKLRMVRRGGYKKGSSFDATSLERVLMYQDFKKRVIEGLEDEQED